MKRTALLAAAALVAATPALASAAPAKASKRTVTSTYQGFLAFTVVDGASGALNCQGSGPCWDFETKKGEKTVVISAKDATGAPVPLQVFTNDDYEGTVQNFCGTGTLTVSPKAPSVVSVRTAVSGVCQGVATQGTLTAVITNK